LIRPDAKARTRIEMTKGARPLPLWMTDGRAAMTRIMCATTAKGEAGVVSDAAQYDPRGGQSGGRRTSNERANPERLVATPLDVGEDAAGDRYCVAARDGVRQQEPLTDRSLGETTTDARKEKRVVRAVAV
jgi:hypothetical protein